MGVFSRVFKGRDGNARLDSADASRDRLATPRKQWDDAWTRKDVGPEEVADLLKLCTQEIKSKALDMPFLLLPFRPSSDTNAARTFIRTYFTDPPNPKYSGVQLRHELRITEPEVLCSIMKWCWSRLPGGVVGWDVYELFSQGERESQMAKHAFDTLVPLSVESHARKTIIFDFFEVLAAIAANGKANGLGGRKLSRLAGWWAFTHSDSGKGFKGGYRSWTNAADATSHLFFAYLRSLAPESIIGSTVSQLPRSLQALVSQTEYPPETPSLLLTRISKVDIVVATVSPTPFALVRRAGNFEFPGADPALRAFSDYEDPVEALTSECRRVLDSISSTNSTGQAIPEIVSPQNDASWSQFENSGFSSFLDGPSGNQTATPANSHRLGPSGTNEFGRPVTPSWGEFLSSGFGGDQRIATPHMLLPPDQLLPAVDRGHVQGARTHAGDNGQPGELASVIEIDLDETFWWVWMSSLAAEETPLRKAVFGRCALVEADIAGARWLVVEEQLKGANEQADSTKLVLEKKSSRFASFTRGRTQRESSFKRPHFNKTPYQNRNATIEESNSVIGPDQMARVQAAAAALVQKRTDEEEEAAEGMGRRRGRTNEHDETRTNSVMTLQPNLLKAAGPAMQWARKFDKESVRSKYLGDNLAGRGHSTASSLTHQAALSAGDATAMAQSNDDGAEEIPTIDGPWHAEGAHPSQEYTTSKSSTSMDWIGYLRDKSGGSPSKINGARSVDSRPGTAASVSTRTTLPKTLRKSKALDAPSGAATTTRDSVTSNVAASRPRPITPQQKPPTSSAMAAAAAAASSRRITNSTAESSPPKRNTPAVTAPPKRQASIRGLQGIFNRVKPQTPEDYASTNGAADNGSYTSSPEKSLGRRTSVLRRQPAAPVANPQAAFPPPTQGSSLLPAHGMPEIEYADVGGGEPGPASTADAPDLATLHEPDEYLPTSAPALAQLAPTIYRKSPYVPTTIEPSLNEIVPASKIQGTAEKPSDPSARFSDFSQGSLEEVPAFLADDDSREDEGPIERAITPPPHVEQQYQTRAAALLHKGIIQGSASPEQAVSDSVADVMPADDFQLATTRSKIPIEVQREQRRFPIVTPGLPGDRTIGMSKVNSRERPMEAKIETAADRWAQIRQNAAKRRTPADETNGARRPDESRPRSEPTDGVDDEATSGEESIEARVARIKARVAELTSGQTISTRT